MGNQSMKREPVIAYHATRNLEALVADGAVRPMRLPSVYLFSELTDAHEYATEFGYEAVIDVLCPAKNVQRRWKPSYCKQGQVIKLRPGATAIVASRNVTYLPPKED